jgi:hypothetical protein
VVELHPLDIKQACLHIDRAVDVIHEAKLAECKLEQRATGGVVGVLEVEDLGNMVFDVQ